MIIISGSWYNHVLILTIPRNILKRFNLKIFKTNISKTVNKKFHKPVLKYSSNKFSNILKSVLKGQKTLTASVCNVIKQFNIIVMSF